MTEERPSLQGLDGLRRLWKSSRRSLIGASAVVAQPLLLNAVSDSGDLLHHLFPWPLSSAASGRSRLSLLAATSVLVGLGTRLAFVRSISTRSEPGCNALRRAIDSARCSALWRAPCRCLPVFALGYPTVVLRATLLLVFGGVFSAITGVVSDLLTALERLPSMSAVTAVGGLVLTCSSVIAIWLGAGPVGLGMSYIIGPILTAMLALSLVHRQLFPVRAVFARRAGRRCSSSRRC